MQRVRDITGCSLVDSRRKALLIITHCHVVCPRMIDKDDRSVVGDREARVVGCEMKTFDRLALIPFDNVHEYRGKDHGGNPS